MPHQKISKGAGVISAVVLLLMSTVAAAGAGGDFSKLEGPYLGQTPPGQTPEIFAPGLIESDLHSCPVFSEDGLEAYWSTMEGSSILTSRYDGQGWTVPEKIGFADFMGSSGEPCLTPDGKRLLFISSADPGYGVPKQENVWVSDRDADGWRRPGLLSKTVSSIPVHWQVSVAANGNLYFHSLASGGGDIFVAEFRDGKYSEPQRLPDAINTPHYDNAPFIAPDESYLIFCSVDFKSTRMSDMYVSFRNADGTWGEAKALAELNQDRSNEACPNVTRDGKYLFYLSNTKEGFSAHWVSASILDKYRLQ